MIKNSLFLIFFLSVRLFAQTNGVQVDPEISLVTGSEKGNCPGTVTSFQVTGSQTIEYWTFSITPASMGTFVLDMQGNPLAGGNQLGQMLAKRIWLF